MAGSLFLLFSQIVQIIDCALDQPQKCQKTGNPRILTVMYNSDNKCCLCLQKVTVTQRFPHFYLSSQPWQRNFVLQVWYLTNIDLCCGCLDSYPATNGHTIACFLLQNKLSCITWMKQSWLKRKVSNLLLGSRTWIDNYDRQVKTTVINV